MSFKRSLSVCHSVLCAMLAPLAEEIWMSVHMSGSLQSALCSKLWNGVERLIWMVEMEAVVVSQLAECLYILLSLRDANTPQRGEERLPTDKLFSQLSQQVTGTCFLSLYANKLSIHSTTQTQVPSRVVSTMCWERKQVCFFKIMYVQGLARSLWNGTRPRYSFVAHLWSKSHGDIGRKARLV